MDQSLALSENRQPRFGSAFSPRNPRLSALILLAGLAAGCATSTGNHTALLLPDPARRVAIDSLIAEMPMGGENIVRRMIAEGDNSTAFLVRIADREAPHRHTEYDLTVVLVEGLGTLWVDGSALAMHPGDTAHIPRNVAHHFVNTGNTPATALAVFSPSFSGPDSEPVATNPQGGPEPASHGRP